MTTNDWVEIQLSDILEIKHGYAFSGDGIRIPQQKIFL